MGFLNGGDNEDTVNGNNSFLAFGRGEYTFEPMDDTEATVGVWGFFDDITGDTTTVFETAIMGSETDIDVNGQYSAIGFDLAMEKGRFSTDVNFFYAFLDGDSPGGTAAAGTKVFFDGSDLNVVGDGEFWSINVRKAYWITEGKWQAVGMFEYANFDDLFPNGDYWATTLGVNYHGLEKFRSVVRINWVHLEMNHGAFPGFAASNSAEDFLLTEWQVKF